MTIIFEPGRQFSEVPEKYRDLLGYICGGRYESLRTAMEEASQAVKRDERYEGVEFSIGTVTLRPHQLPIEITRVPISMKFPYTDIVDESYTNEGERTLDALVARTSKSNPVEDVGIETGRKRILLSTAGFQK